VTGQWELLATRPGGTVTSLVTSGSLVLAATPAGVRRSTDSGRSWSVLSGAIAPPPEVVVASPAFADDAILLAGTADGLLRSSDAGQSWQLALVGSRVLSIAFPPSFHQDGLVLVGTEKDGLLRSNDRGQTWTSGNPGLLDLTVLGLACSPAFEVDHTVIAATASGLFRSSNAGRAWRAIETMPGEPAVQSIALASRFPSHPVILAGTEADGLLRSPDGGGTWHSVGTLAGRSVTALAWRSESTVAAGTDVGVTASHDGGATWSHMGREMGPVLSVAFAPDGALLAGMPRHGVARSRDLASWETANAGLQANLVTSVALSPEFESDRTLYLAGLEDGVSTSTDAGASWASANAGLAAGTAVFGLVASPAGVYAATSTGVFLRRGRSDEWKQVHPTPARAVRAAGRRVVALGVSGALVTSSDDAASWQLLPWPASAGQARSMALAGPSTLFVGSTLPSTSEVTVWWSTDGQRWQRVLVEHAADAVVLAAPPINGYDSTIFVGVGDAVLRRVPGVVERIGAERRPGWRRAQVPATVTALETSPSYREDKTVMAGTTAGVCISRDAGLTFQPWSAGMGNVPVVAVAFSPAYLADRQVHAVELGGRIWRRKDV
jgi:hypothetical protein